MEGNAKFIANLLCDIFLYFLFGGGDFRKKCVSESNPVIYIYERCLKEDTSYAFPISHSHFFPVREKGHIHIYT